MEKRWSAEWLTPQTAAWTASLAGTALLIWSISPGQLPPGPGGISSGVDLLHGLPLPVGTPYLPLPVMEAALVDREGSVFPLLYSFYPAAELLLAAAAGALAAPALATPLLAAAFLLLGRGIPVHQLAPAMPHWTLLLAAALLWRERRRTAARTTAAAAVLGMGFLYRSVFAFLPPLMSLAELLRRRPKRGQALILLLVPYLFAIPWTLAQWRLTGAFSPFESGAANCNIVTGALGKTFSIEGDWTSLIDDASVDPASSAAVLGWAVRTIAARPWRYARSVLRRAWFAAGLHPWLSVAALLSLPLLRRRRGGWMLALLPAYYLGIHCLMSVRDQYFLALWPLCAVLAGSGAASLLRLPRDRGLARSVLRGARVVLAAAFICAAAAWTWGAVSTLRSAAALNRPPDRRRADLDAAIRRAPADPWLRAKRGRTRLRNGDARGGADDLLQAARLRPGPEQALEAARARHLAGDSRRMAEWKVPDDIRLGHLWTGGGIMKAQALLADGRRQPARDALRAAWEDSQRQVQMYHSAPDAEVLRVLRDAEHRVFVERAIRLSSPLPPGERAAFLDLLWELAPDDPRLQYAKAVLAARGRDWRTDP